MLKAVFSLLAGFALLGPAAAVAGQSASDCAVLRSIVQPKLLRELRFGFTETGGVALAIVNGAKFSQDPASCDFHANPIRIHCRWEFYNYGSATHFFEYMLKLGNVCLNYPLSDKAVPNDPSALSAVRIAEYEGYSIDLAEYSLQSDVTLYINPERLAAATAGRKK